jgi:hypothetical protein
VARAVLTGRLRVAGGKQPYSQFVIVITVTRIIKVRSDAVPAQSGQYEKNDPPLQVLPGQASSPGINEVMMPEYFALTFPPDSFNFPCFQSEKILGDRLAVRTLASHAGNQGSIPCGTTRMNEKRS